MTKTNERADRELLIKSFSNAGTLETLPALTDVATAPLNPPADIQEKFVGASYETAYEEAAAFVEIVAAAAEKHGTGLGSGPVIDFGSGWGRISRFLLNYVDPTSLYAADVDSEMTALVNTTMPGINALTVTPLPPTVLRDKMANCVVAFSVFSHLAPSAHEAWAAEFGRLVAPGGIVTITVLGKRFLRQISDAKQSLEAGDDGVWLKDLAGMFSDITATRKEFQDGGIVYSPRSNDGVRTDDFYGWAAASRPYVKKLWGAAGFEVVEWIPPAHPIGQIVVVLRKRSEAVPAQSADKARKAAAKAGKKARAAAAKALKSVKS